MRFFADISTCEGQPMETNQQLVLHQLYMNPELRRTYLLQCRQFTDEELAALHKELEIKIRGKRCPKPVERWNQVGLTDKLLATLIKNGFEKPFAIQRQTIPYVNMSIMR